MNNLAVRWLLDMGQLSEMAREAFPGPVGFTVRLRNGLSQENYSYEEGMNDYIHRAYYLIIINLIQHHYISQYIICHLADAFIQSDLQLIRLSMRHSHLQQCGVKGPTAVQILSWPHQGSNR